MNTRTSNRLVTAANDVLEIIQWDQAYNRNGLKINRTVMNVLRTYANNSTLRVEKVSLKKLQDATGLGRAQVIEHIRENIEAGWLAKPSRGDSGGNTNEYQLTYGQTSEKLSRGSSVNHTSSVNCTTPSSVDHTRVVQNTGQGSSEYQTPTTHITTQKETTKETTNNIIEEKASKDALIPARDKILDPFIATEDLSPLGEILDDVVDPYALDNRETGSPRGSSDRTADTSPLETSTMSNTVGSSAQPCGASVYAVCKKDPFMDDYACSTHDEFIEPEPEVLPPPVSSWGRPKCGSSSCSDPECAVHGGLSQLCPF